MIFQLGFVIIHLKPFIIERKRSKLIIEIGEFHEKHFSLFIESLPNTLDLSDRVKLVDEFANKYIKIYKKYREGATISELKDYYFNLKVFYAKYLPSVKKELRSEHIDLLLSE